MLTTWAVLTAVVSAYLYGIHTAGLPVPSIDDTRFSAAIAATRTPDDQGQWLAIHVLLADCECSGRVLRVLQERLPRHDVHERVLIINGTEEAVATLVSLGYDARAVRPTALVQEYRVEVAPLFVLVDPDGAVRYVGGYTDRRRGPVLRDREITEAALGGTEVPASLPVLGCAVTEALRAQIDPLGIRPGPSPGSLARPSAVDQGAPE